MFDAMIPPMIPQDLASQAVAWLLTYTLHSTLFLGLAWLASRRLARRMPAVEEAVWRFALVAGLITASLQLAAGREPLTGSWSLAPAAASSVNAPAPSAVPLPHAAEPRAFAAVPAVPRSEAPAPSRSLRVSLPAAIAGFWLAGALLLAASWSAAHLRLRRRLRPRPQVLEATMVTLLGELRERAGLQRRVRLSCSSRLPVPIALGLRRPEICVPPRALVGLAPEQQEGLLAHELAHLVRRDPFWLAFGRLLASVLFFQPLNWVAVRRLRELSELLCDEWAVGRTGRPVSLARCLAEVAGWSIQPLRSLPAPGMADRPSHLGKRIRRLLEEAGSPQRRVHPAWLAAGMVLLVVAVAAAAPGVHAAVAGDQEEIAEAPEPADPVAAAAEEDFADAEDAEEAAEAMAGVEGEVAGEIAGEIMRDIPGDMPGDITGDLTGLTESLGEISQISTEIAMDLSGDLMAATMAGDLSEEEADELGRHIDELFEGIGRQMEERLEPQMKVLEERLDKDLAQLETSGEMRELERRAQAIAERARPSEEEMAKLRADVDRLRAEGGLSEEDKRKIREEARRMREENRLTDKDRAEIDQLRRQAHEMAQRSMREHQPEIDQMREQIREEARAMREEIRRQLDNDPKLRELRERRHREREHLREERRERDQTRERAPRPPRPERHVHLHVAPEVRVQVEPAVAPAAETRVDVSVAPAVAPVAERPGRIERPAIAPRPRVHVHVTPAVAPAARRKVDVKVRPEVAPAPEAPEAPETPAPVEAPEPPAR